MRSGPRVIKLIQNSLDSYLVVSSFFMGRDIVIFEFRVVGHRGFPCLLPSCWDTEQGVQVVESAKYLKGKSRFGRTKPLD